MTTKRLEMRDKTVFDGVVFKFVLKVIYKTWFKLAGWKVINVAPKGLGVTIAAPHTSNWDIVYALGAAILFDVKIYFSIKESWCRVPVLGSFILWLGAMPINRQTRGQGQVELIKRFVERHKNAGTVFFLFTPEGTRGAVQKWKTGFYHVAKDSNLPVFLAKVDYRTKVSGVFHSFVPTGDKNADIEAIQESYKSVCAKYPEIQFPVYKGPLPEISTAEVRVMQAMFALKGMATQAEIAAKARFDELSTDMLDFLVEKGILERISTGGNVVSYKLTLAGSGFLLHMTPTLR
ncbi:MAG: acyltransferase [Proteobacteria bacterium]|nr:MAG: acyltransferase [Pseudomonadota bacterium]